MSQRTSARWTRSIGPALGLALVIFAAVGCCLPTRPQALGGVTTARDVVTDAVSIMVTLAAEEGDALLASRERVLARLRHAMTPNAFAAIRTYETLPLVALSATPDVIALLLTLPDVRSVEADKSFSL